LRSYSLCNILSDEKMGLSPMNEYAWLFVKYKYSTCSILLKILPFALYASPLSYSLSSFEHWVCFSKSSQLLHLGTYRINDTVSTVAVQLSLIENLLPSNRRWFALLPSNGSTRYDILLWTLIFEHFRADFCGDYSGPTEIQILPVI
jgi:hypothetical protein